MTLAITKVERFDQLMEWTDRRKIGTKVKICIPRSPDQKEFILCPLYVHGFKMAFGDQFSKKKTTVAMAFEFN